MEIHTIMHYRALTSIVISSVILIVGALSPGEAGAADGAVPSTTQQSSEDGLVSLLSAEFALQAGETAVAAKDYLDAARKSDDPALAERAARVALAAGEPDVATAALDRWAELAPDDSARLPLQASLSMQLGDPDAAAEALARLLKIGDGSLWQLAAQALAQSAGPELRLTILADLVSRDALPARDEAWFGFGALARDAGGAALSERMADQAMQRFPDAPRVWLWQADRLRRAGDLPAAKAAVDKALSLDPANSRLRMTAAAELNAQGDPAAAAIVLAAGPQDTLTRTGRVAYLARAEDTAGMRALYAEIKEAIASQPSQLDDSTRFLLGQLAELLELQQAGLEWYEGVREADRRGHADMRIAVLLDQLGRFNDAEARLRELQASDEHDGELIRDSYLLQGELLRRHGKSGEEEATYSRGLLIFEDDPELLYARALSRERLNQLDAAEADLRTIVQQDPDNADALNALGYTLADRTDRYEEALGYIRRALELQPDTAAIVDSLGWVLYRMGNAEEALQHLDRAFELQPDPEVAAHLGEVLWISGQQERARTVWQQGLELDPDNAVLKQTMKRLEA